MKRREYILQIYLTNNIIRFYNYNNRIFYNYITSK